MAGGLDKHIIGAMYGNPYQAPWTENDYSQNTPTPNVKGGGDPYKNPRDVVDQHFFSPTTPNDAAFSDMQASGETDSADPIGQIMAEFDAAQDRLNDNT